MREIGEMLVAGKEENARIRAEGILRERDFLAVYEYVGLQGELLAQRVAVIAAAEECPADIFTSIASLIYCSDKIEAPELVQIRTQIALKFGVEWAKGLVDDKKHASKKIVSRLDVRVPKFEDVSAVLKEIADTYDLDWTPTITHPPCDECDDVKGDISDQLETKPRHSGSTEKVEKHRSGSGGAPAKGKGGKPPPFPKAVSRDAEEEEPAPAAEEPAEEDDDDLAGIEARFEALRKK